MSTFGSAPAAPLEQATSDDIPEFPSPLPLVVAGLVLVLSIGIALLLASDPRAAVVGYLLTPFGVVAALAWARIRHLRSTRNAWYDRSRGEQQLRILQILTLLSFLVGLVHIWRMATEVASWFA